MKFSTLATFFSFVAIVPTVFSAPVQRDRSHASGKRAFRPSFPTVIYSDAFVPGQNGPPSTSQINGFNVMILSFLLTSGPADQVEAWTQLSADQRSAIKSEYNNAGINLMVSAFGSTDEPTTAGVDPIAMANTMSDFVKEFDLDGIDVDYEDFPAINAQDGKAEQWLISFTTQLRANLPSGQYLLTHAPVAPWFSHEIYPTGAYHRVNQEVGNMIDWYNIQFYNQGASEYTTCDGLLNESSSTFPNTAVFQINQDQGVDMSKIVIGKPATTADGVNGVMSTSLLATCLQQAVAADFTGGVMVFQFPHADSTWIAQVTSLIGSAPAQPPAVPPAKATTSAKTTPTKMASSSQVYKTTSTSSKAAPTSSGTCSGVPAWNSATAFNQGSKVTFNGHLWTAAQWNEAETPGGSSGAWVDDGSC